MVQVADDDIRVIEDDPTHQEGEAVVVDEAAAQAAAQAAAKRDERVDNADDDEPVGRTPEETEQLREQRRAERRAKKQRQQAARDSNIRELNFLRQRNEALERRFSAMEQRTFQTEFSSVDAQLATIEGQMRQADTIIQKGITDRDGASVTEAQNIKADLQEAKRRLIAQKERIVQEARESADPAKQQGQQQERQQLQPQQPEVDPDLLMHANRWKAANPWYRDQNPDRDSKIAGLIDNELVEEGYDPATGEHWAELTRRLKEALPHRFARSNGGQREANGGQRESRGPAMANGQRERALKPGEMYVSPERKEALIEMGAWEDPKLRAKYLKAYADYDAAAAAQTA